MKNGSPRSAVLKQLSPSSQIDNNGQLDCDREHWLFLVFLYVPQIILSLSNCCLPTPQLIHDIICSNLIAAESESLSFCNYAWSTQSNPTNLELHWFPLKLKGSFCFLWGFPLSCQLYMHFLVLLTNCATIYAAMAIVHTWKSLKY